MNAASKIVSLVLLGAMLASPRLSAQTDGSASLKATLLDYNGTGTKHWTVAWVTTSSGTFINTLRKQGPSMTATHWNSHCGIWWTAKGGTNSTTVDGYSSATAQDYTGTNSPVILTWNGRNTNNVLMPDGTYKFWVQYAEDSGQGPHTTNGLLWTKGPTGVTNNYANFGATITSLQVAWKPSTVPPVAPTIVSAPPPPNGTVGTPYLHACAATGTAPIIFTATGLPTGLSISANGLISGTPLAAGTFPGTITATNGTLPNATQNFSIVIAPSANYYVGSATCNDCHPDKYALLQQSIHSKMIRPGAHLPGVIHGNLTQPNAPTTNDVHWAMGGWSHEENYIRTNWTGSNWAYTVTQFKWDPIAGTYSNGEPLRDWTTQCAGCHTTGFDPATRTWSELNVSCESCHGPGGNHASTEDPSLIVIDRSSESCGRCHIRAESVATGSFTNRQFGFPIGYLAGAPGTLAFIPEPLTSTVSFFPNGASKQHRQQYLDLNHPGQTPARHYLEGVTCTTCHDPHTAGIVSVYANALPTNTYGIKIFNNANNTTNYVAWDGAHLWNPVTHTPIPQATRSDLCKSCHSVNDHHVHQFTAAALAANITCADCHMPDIIDVDPATLRGALHPHRFTAIKPETSMLYGPGAQPNSCTYRCHQSKGATVAERAAWADSILTQRVGPFGGPGQQPKVRVVGTPGYEYAIEVSSNLTSWVSVTTNAAALLTNAVPHWGFEYTDPDPSAAPKRFYRSKQVVPVP